MNKIDQYLKKNNIKTTDLFNKELYPVDDTYECLKRKYLEMEIFWKLNETRSMDEDTCICIFENYMELCFFLVMTMTADIGDDAITCNYAQKLEFEHICDLYKEEEYNQIIDMFEDVIGDLAYIHDLKISLLKLNDKKYGRPNVSLDIYINKDIFNDNAPKVVEKKVFNCLKNLFSNEKGKNNKTCYSRIMMGAVDAKVLTHVPTSEDYYKDNFGIDVSHTSMGKVNTRLDQDDLRFTGKKKNRSEVYEYSKKAFDKLRQELLP